MPLSHALLRPFCDMSNELTADVAVTSGVCCAGLQLAFESLAVITNALMKLEVGSVGVSR